MCQKNYLFVKKFPKIIKNITILFLQCGDMNRLVVLLFTYFSFFLRKTVVSGSFQTLGICITPLSHKTILVTYLKLK